jgi:hypothetical protein
LVELRRHVFLQFLDIEKAEAEHDNATNDGGFANNPEMSPSISPALLTLYFPADHRVLDRRIDP